MRLTGPTHRRPCCAIPAKAATLPYATQPTLESHIYVADTTEGRKLVANPYFHQVDTTGQQLPYISRQDELYKNDNEVRILALINGEVDYKSQSVQLPSAPLLLENQEAGGYTVQLKPTIAMPAFSFNVTSDDEAKREVFNNIDFRKAMSAAINRDELNEVAFFGQGVPMAYVGFSPVPEVAAEAATQGIAFDPDGAAAMLDGIGMVDADGDGFRDLPNGDPIVLNMQFATQGVAGEVVELVAQNWADAGIQTAVKEVTPDEYRAAQSANELDVMMWQRGQPVAVALGSSEEFVPPYSSYFGHRTGMKLGGMDRLERFRRDRASAVCQGHDCGHRRAAGIRSRVRRSKCSWSARSPRTLRITCCSSGPSTLRRRSWFGTD